MVSSRVKWEAPVVSYKLNSYPLTPSWCALHRSPHTLVIFLNLTFTFHIGQAQGHLCLLLCVPSRAPALSLTCSQAAGKAEWRFWVCVAFPSLPPLSHRSQLQGRSLEGLSQMKSHPSFQKSRGFYVLGKTKISSPIPPGEGIFLLSYGNLVFVLLRAAYCNLDDRIAGLHRWYRMGLHQLSYFTFSGLTTKIMLTFQLSQHRRQLHSKHTPICIPKYNF